jgi:phenylacetate-CoA ligase
VRYRTGDMASLDANPCQCGRGLPLIKEIQGRSTDFVVAQDGTVMHGLALIYVLREIPGLRAFKIVQESTALTRVLVVPEGTLRPSQVVAIATGLKARLGESVTIAVDSVAEIPAEASGKFRYVISHAAAFG